MEKCDVTYSWEDIPQSCVSKNDGEYFVKSTSRRCVGSDGSVGTYDDCLSSKSTTYWKSTKAANWTTARDHCKQLGGKLFDDVSLSDKELMMITEHTRFNNRGSFWTNIWSPANNEKWENYESGEVIPEENIDWGNDDPDIDAAGDRAAAVDCVSNTWSDSYTSETLYYVCIMLK